MASASDPAYDQYAALRTDAYKTAVANIHNQRDDLLRKAGLSGVYDQDGTLSGYHVASGPGSEFGAYQQTMKGLAGQGEQLDAQRAGLGFGGGLSQQMADLGHMNDQQAYNDFSEPVLGAMAGYGQQETDAGTSYWGDLLDHLHSNAQGKAGQIAAGNPVTTADFSGLANTIPGYGSGKVDNGAYGKKNNINPSGTKVKPKPRRRRR